MAMQNLAEDRSNKRAEIAVKMTKFREVGSHRNYERNYYARCNI